MNISVIGYGKMGQLVEEVALQKGIQVISIVDPKHEKATHQTVSAASMEGVDVCICFTEPSVALQNIADACNFKKDLVMATTGWQEHFDDVRKQVEEAGIGLVYSSNFSIGVNIFFHLVEQSAKIMNRFNDYDISGFEIHHNRKKDSPSGTGETIANLLVENIERKSLVQKEKLDRSIDKEELHFASLRVGDVPGTHSVMYDSNFDSIELKHTARNRSGFAVGSITAAHWIQGKKGLFTEKDLMQELLK